MTTSLWHSLASSTKAMQDGLKDVRSPDAWNRLRPERYREFLRCLGLDTVPERCDPQMRDYGTFEGKGFQARRIGFQILPECWTSATVYYPASQPRTPAPAVLYVCGHATIGTWHYQYHPIMWARRGYVCLILDTIQQNDSPGEHAGSFMGRHDAWLSLGYTSAGGELLNALRALDVLAADPFVDADRLGVTGVSGGGACSFYLAAVDERIKAVSTLCGISTPCDAVANRHLIGHCDCMYPHNVYRRDISEYAALIAPRAALFCFADHDNLFHPEETRGLVARTQHIYQLMGCPERCRLVTCPGGHGDHEDFDDATSAWFDRYVAGEERPSAKRGERELPETTTAIFNGQPPSPNRLHLLPHLISPRGTLPLPRTPEDWPTIRDQAISRLRDDVLGVTLADDPEAKLELDGDWRWGEALESTVNRTYRGQIAGVEIWLRTVISADSRPQIVLAIAGEGQSAEMALSWVRCGVDSDCVASAGFEPRVAGANQAAPVKDNFPPGSRYKSFRNLSMRAMALIGTTPVMMTVNDIGIALNCLDQIDELQGYEIYLYGKGDAGVAALYRGLIDARVTGVIAEDAPASHLDGAPVLGILRAFDMPQAVGLMAPRKVALITPGNHVWTWPSRVYERLGCAERFIMSPDVRHALGEVLA